MVQYFNYFSILFFKGDLMDILLVSICIAVLATVVFLLLQLKTSQEKQTKLLFSLEETQRRVDKLDELFRSESAQNRDEVSRLIKDNRSELSESLKLVNDSVLKNLNELTTQNNTRLESVREVVDKRIYMLQQDNSKKLDEMRVTVDEKLHATLEKRLGESFKLVSERLELVHKGLGEMHTLASGVGDLKRVLTNVKTRGIWGEIQLGNILEQLLTPEQYGTNVKTKPNSAAFVEYAVKLPGKSNDKDSHVWLPIDSKFPQDIYEELLNAQEAADPDRVAQCVKRLEMSIKQEAKQIQEKYLSPPDTTDFAVMFLPIEGLYAEVLRCPGLYDTLMTQYRITVAGPTTLAALLNSLQMGFKTLAIEQRSSEVWQILAAVKSEFGKFGDLLDKTHKKLQEAGNTIENASRKTRTIERKLRNVQELPEAESDTVPLLTDLM